jgi:cytochrome c oxidase subunit IV
MAYLSTIEAGSLGAWSLIVGLSLDVCGVVVFQLGHVCVSVVALVLASIICVRLPRVFMVRLERVRVCDGNGRLFVRVAASWT